MAPSTPIVVEAFGDPDDHLRLSTLIADAVVRLIDAPATRGTARRLTDDRRPRSWRDRRTDFTELVDRIPSGTNILLHDPDAFAETIEQRVDDWDDASLLRERSDFFCIMIVAVGREAIRLRRTAPDPRVSQRLADTEAGPESSSDLVGEWARSVAPDARPALSWLLERGHLSQRAVEELVEDGTGPELDRHLIVTAYDHLPAPTREVAHRLAVLRGDQRINGAIGAFPLAKKAPREASSGATMSKQRPLIPRVHFKALCECGFVQTRTAGTVRMPRLVRHALAARAEAAAPERVEDDHRWVATQLTNNATNTVIQQIEGHHHAVRGLDCRLAVATAKFYATDLRELGIRLSAKEKWIEAADAYRTITQMDPADAYAWEYLGYNLVRADAVTHEKEILEAYERAFEREPTNPLYHGRFLGFRGRLGQDVTAEFDHGLRVYRFRGIDRFACEVLKAMKRGGRQGVADAFVAAHPSLLKNPEVKRVIAPR